MPSHTEKWWEVSVTKSVSVSREWLAGTQAIGKYNVTSDASNPSGLFRKIKRNSVIVDFISIIGFFPVHELYLLLASEWKRIP